VIKRNNFTADERGATLIEFGLVAIVMFTFFFGIIDFARALYTYHFVANAAREATRYLSVRGSQCQLGPSCTVDFAQYTQTITPGGITENQVVLTPSWPGIGQGSTGDGGCEPATPPNISNSPGCVVQVQVTYPFKFILPLMPKGSCTVQGANGPENGNICMSSTSEMVISQ
jgi:TadE-like protein